MSEEEIQLTPEEEQIYQRQLEQVYQSAPQYEEKPGVFQFLKDVFTGKDSSKVSCLDSKELFSVRILQETAQYCELMKMKKVAAYLIGNAEITLSTALSKKPGVLLQAAITQKRELRSGSITKAKKKFFGSKEEGET